MRDRPSRRFSRKGMIGGVLVLAFALLPPGSPAPDEAATPPPFAAASWDNAYSLAGSSPSQLPGSMQKVAQTIGANVYWTAGYTGAGIDVAIIDTGVTPVTGLAGAGKIVNGPDLSFDSQADSLRYLDANGHGTHLAGIIAGRDPDVVSLTSPSFSSGFRGIAPDARIVNIKAGNHDGAVDVSQVIAAIDWVIEHRKDNGLDIRVLNLAYGTNGQQAYTSDPLAFAVERAWKAGIVVLVANGNDGNGAPLRNPATDPYVIAVGASDTTQTNTTSIAGFSNCGTKSRYTDILAPGRSLVSLRTPGSVVDQANPQAVVSDRYFLGSGTSQAAAVMSGAAALLLDQRPQLTPDQVKSVLTATASRLTGNSKWCQGAGQVNLAAAFTANGGSGLQTWTPATGNGTLEGARGSFHLTINGVTLQGEQDIFGQAWNPTTWLQLAAAGMTWSGGTWNGSGWAGDGWQGLSWSGLSWSGLSWSGLSWSGLSWSDAAWNGLSWSGLSWSDSTWSGLSWSGLSWSGQESNEAS